MIRAFIAIDVPAAVKKTIFDVQTDLRRQHPRDAISWSRSEGIHLTLKFLGDVAEVEMHHVIDAVKAAASESSPFEIVTTVTGGFPSLRKPRVLWWGVDGGAALLDLQQRVDAQLLKLGFPKEDKAFHPHLTVGRVKDLVWETKLPDRFGGLKLEVVHWRAEEVNVMSSVLKAGGAEYKALGRLKLSAAIKNA